MSRYRSRDWSGPDPFEGIDETMLEQRAQNDADDAAENTAPVEWLCRLCADDPLEYGVPCEAAPDSNMRASHELVSRRWDRRRHGRS